MAELDALKTELFAIQIIAALLCGAIIGIDRQIRGKPVGVRTCVIVVLASSLYVTLSQQLTTESGDPSRVLAAVATGVGFLGAGVIISENGRVRGLTTAALIWMLAAIGAAIGLGYPYSAVISSVLIMLIVKSIDFAEKRFKVLQAEAKPNEHEL